MDYKGQSYNHISKMEKFHITSCPARGPWGNYRNVIFSKVPGFGGANCEVMLFILAEAEAFLRSFGGLQEQSLPLKIQG